MTAPLPVPVDPIEALREAIQKRFESQTEAEDEAAGAAYEAALSRVSAEWETLRQQVAQLEQQVAQRDQILGALEKWHEHGRILLRWLPNLPTDEEREMAKESLRAAYPEMWSATMVLRPGEQGGQFES